MDKNNNEIYKNWYSTNINGKKTCRQLLLSLTPLPEMHDVCREYWSPCTSFFLSAITCSETVVYVFHRKFSEYIYFSY